MRALVFADRDSSCVAPLDREYAVPTLPLAGKAVIVYTVEELVSAGVTEIVFVVADHADSLEHLLGDGRRWGGRFRFVLGRGQECPSKLWSRLRIGDDEPLLVLRGDLLRSPSLATFNSAAQGQAGTAICGVGSDPRGGVILLRPAHADPRGLLDLLRLDEPAAVPEDYIALPDLEVRLLDSLQAYHQTCLDLVSGRIPGLQPDGRELALGLSVGLQARVSPRSLKQGRAYVGDNSRVHPEAELLGDVMISRDAVIDRAAVLYHCVILPRSYVGEMLEVNDAIVAGDTLIRVDTGVVLTITDAFLLGKLGGAAGVGSIVSWLDRLGGLALLLLSLPLWLFALFAAAVQTASPRPQTSTETVSTADSATGRTDDPAEGFGAGRFFEREILIGNRADSVVGGVDGAFCSWRINTRIRLLSRLPRLLSVARGDLRLIGVSPLTPEESQSRSEDWQRVRDKSPVGMIGPTQLMLGADAPLDERLMSDAFFVGQPGWLKNARVMLDALRIFVSAHSWQSSRF
jgi:hypothetical protein